MAFVRLVPLFPFNLVNYAFGLTRIRIGEYVLHLLYMHGAGCDGVYLSGLRGARSRIRTGRGNPQGSACLGAACGRRFPAAAGSPAQGSHDSRKPATPKRRWRTAKKFAMIDVCSAEEFHGRLGHIAGASNIPIAELSEESKS